VTAVAQPTHTLSKPEAHSIEPWAGPVVEGDAHLASRSRNRSRVARDRDQPICPGPPHLMASCTTSWPPAGFALSAGQMGENVTTRGALCSGCRLVPGCISARPPLLSTGCAIPASLERIQPG